MRAPVISDKGRHCTSLVQLSVHYIVGCATATLY